MLKTSRNRKVNCDISRVWENRAREDLSHGKTDRREGGSMDIRTHRMHKENGMISHMAIITISVKGLNLAGKRYGQA